MEATFNLSREDFHRVIPTTGYEHYTRSARNCNSKIAYFAIFSKIIHTLLQWPIDVVEDRSYIEWNGNTGGHNGMNPRLAATHETV